MKTLWRHVCAFILVLLLGIKAFAPEFAADMNLQLMNVLDKNGERRAAIEAMGSRIAQNGVTEELKAALAYLESLIENTPYEETEKAVSQATTETMPSEESPVPLNGVMRRRFFFFSAGGFLLAAFLIFFLKVEELAALLLPVLIHESAHIIALKILGLRVRAIRAEMKGFCIDYSGYSGALGHALVAAAGPAAGIAYAYVCSYFDRRCNIEWLSLSAGCSMLLSLFNFLPALPLDGGRIVESLLCAFFGEQRGKRFSEICSLIVAALMLAGGMWIMFSGGGIDVELAAIWLLFSQSERCGIEKVRKVL